MSPRLWAALAVLAWVGPSHVAAQQAARRPFSSSPTTGSAELLRPPTLDPGSTGTSPALVVPRADPAHAFLVDALVLAAASAGGFWLGAQAPFDPADDDSDFSVWHLATAPAGAAAAVTTAALLSGHPLSGSLRAALLGAGVGLGAGLLATTGTGDAGVVVSFALAHGAASALLLRRGR